jgi:hypothetical protein
MAYAKDRAQWRGAPIEKRVHWQNVFVPHASVTSILEIVEHKANHCALAKRSDGMLVIGETGSGKSHLAEEITRRFKHLSVETEDRTYVPTVLIDAVDTFNSKDFARKVLRALNDPFSERTRAATLSERAHHLFNELQTRVVMIDNFHEIPEKRGNKSVGHICSWIRDLSKAVPALIVLLGNQNSVPVLEMDPQLRRRCSHRSQLPYFNSSSPKNFLEFAKVVRKLDACLPLAESSDLTSDSTLGPLLSATGGIFDYLVKILDEAMRIAVKDQREHIVRGDLEKAFFYRIGSAYACPNPFDGEFRPRKLDLVDEPFTGMV